jgi:molecular chaperone Hsp33
MTPAATPPHPDDMVQPFQIEKSHLRGRLIRLGPALDTILKKHAYPLPVARLLSETVAAATALAFSLKYEGKFTLQSKGDGPVSLLVADVTSKGDLRAYAQFDHDAVAKMGDAGIGLIGKGYLAFTVDQGSKPGRDTYQGIVDLHGATIAEAVQYYFRQSEQIPTGIIAGASMDAAGVWRAGALMLQYVPKSGGKNGDVRLKEGSTAEDDWHRAMLLMGTCSVSELTEAQIAANDLLFRLFHEDGVRVFRPRNLQHHCGCSARIHSTLRMFGAQTIEDMVENNLVTVTCQFCNATYSFDAEARRQLFADAAVDNQSENPA